MKKTASQKRPAYEISNDKLASQGAQRIDWAAQRMPVLKLITEQFIKEKPLKDIRVAACLHVTTETANLMRTLKAGGAKIALCASNPLSTQDDVAAALALKDKIEVYCFKGEDSEAYYRHINWVLDAEPHITMDDGADLTATIHGERPQLIESLLGGTEETTTGVIRLRSMEKDNALKYPIIAVNDAKTKHFFDNRYGTGQSTLDGILRATNVLLAGKKFVVAGYGWCGKGISMRARGMGANVIVTEVDPLKALEAVMDGFRVMTMKEAAKIGDIFVTVTGNTKVIRQEHFKLMHDGAIVCNSGHFNVELDIPALEALAAKKRKLKDNVEEFLLDNETKIYLLSEGRLINLAAAEGHPADVMDMSFANQAMAAAYMTSQAKKLDNKVYKVPAFIDNEIGKLKLRSMGLAIDRLTAEQEEYMNSWKLGT